MRDRALMKQLISLNHLSSCCLSPYRAVHARRSNKPSVLLLQAYAILPESVKVCLAITIVATWWHIWHSIWL